MGRDGTGESTISRVWRWVVGVREGDLRPVEPKANGLSKSERRKGTSCLHLPQRQTNSVRNLEQRAGKSDGKERWTGQDRNHKYKINKELAESEGFEPPIPFRVCRFSRPVPSTTRPTLRTLLFYYRARFFSASACSTASLPRFARLDSRVRAVPAWTVVVTLPPPLGHGCRARR